ncbi:MAG: PAS domain-containing protein [Dehalococcoidales bacterium]|nr:PAS domain-containing protein [Dehalococcoidales bacterium]
MIEQLRKDQLSAMLENLPVDITFVDENDVVRYWNKHDNRIFQRPLSSLGRPTQQCHPDRALDKLNRILTDFRSGRRDSVEFWKDIEGRKIHIRYFAVRDTDGRYLGTLGTDQDITDIKRLESEKVTLD